MQGRKALEAELNDAISAGELELHYQPIVKAGSAVVSSYEALMRWNHPRRGFLMPGQFIQIAEDAGMMTELGNWAIRQACQQAAQLPPHIKVAVNVSPNQFRAASILDVVEKALHNTGLDASRLILELTESVLLSSESIAAQVMDELQKIGVQLALDDFGTGYSSLSYLQRYNFSEVKIDRSFVAGISHMPANLAIVRAIIGLTNDLGIDVVAEGIETAEQAAILKAEGCGYLQGYLYGKPCSFADTLADHAANSLRSLQPKATAHNQIEARKRSGHNML